MKKQLIIIVPENVQKELQNIKQNLGIGYKGVLLEGIKKLKRKNDV